MFRDILSHWKYQEVSGGEGGLFTCIESVTAALLFLFLLFPLSPVLLVSFSLVNCVVQ